MSRQLHLSLHKLCYVLTLRQPMFLKLFRTLLHIALQYSFTYVLLEALPQVCMDNTAQSECRVANIGQGEAEWYL